MTARTNHAEAGFSYIEVMIASTVLLTSLLSLAGMFVLAYSNVATAGSSTQGIAAARQVMEEIRRLPFDSLPNLDGLDTDDPSSTPDSGPEREIARRWRNALAGSGVGWQFTDEETNNWPSGSHQGAELGAAGRIAVVQHSTTLTEVQVRVAVPGRWRDIEMITLIARP